MMDSKGIDGQGFSKWKVLVKRTGNGNLGKNHHSDGIYLDEVTIDSCCE
jgi:hypothetical protein